MLKKLAIGLGVLFLSANCFAKSDGITVVVQNNSLSKNLRSVSAHVLDSRGHKLAFSGAYPFNLQLPFDKLAVASMYTGKLSAQAKAVKLGVSTNRSPNVWCISHKKLTAVKKDVLSFSYPADFTCWTPNAGGGIHKVKAP